MEDLILKHWAPIVYLHTDERYWPINWSQHYLPECQLRNEKTKALFKPMTKFHIHSFNRWVREYDCLNSPTTNKGDNSSYTLSLKNGRDNRLCQPCTHPLQPLKDVPIYYHVQGVTGHMDEVYVKFYFAYGYNGPSYILGCKKFPAGAHQADKEHITLHLRLGPRPDHDPPELIKAYYSKHYGGYWLRPDQLEYEGTRPVVYAARNSHACYAHAGNHKRFWRTITDACDRGHRWNARDFQRIHTRWDLLSPDRYWMRFYGDWGNGHVDSFVESYWFMHPGQEPDHNYGQGCCFSTH